MKAVFIWVDDAELKFELQEIDIDSPTIYRYFAPRFIYARSLSDEFQQRDPLRFERRDFVCCDQIHQVYVWDLLRLDHEELQKSLKKFLRTHFHPTNPEET